MNENKLTGYLETLKSANRDDYPYLPINMAIKIIEAVLEDEVVPEK